MATYKINIQGCDGDTKFEMELDENEFKAIFRLAKISHKVSEYVCQPVVKIDGYKIERRD